MEVDIAEFRVYKKTSGKHKRLSQEWSDGKLIRDYFVERC
jgi:hypothetical protein